MAIILAVSNHKGGVGKTTSTVNIGAGLHKLGKRVLLVDLDSQANLTQSLGLTDHTPTVSASLQSNDPLAPATFKPGLDVIAADTDLAQVEVELINEFKREERLKELLAPLADQYDYILLDCPPHLGIITVNALAAANYVIVPLQSEFLAMQGLGKLMDTVAKVQQFLNKGLQMGGVFVTQYDARKILNRNVVDTIREHFGDKAFTTQIRDNVSLAEAPTTGQDIFAYNPESNGAADYAALSQEIHNRFKA